MHGVGVHVHVHVLCGIIHTAPVSPPLPLPLPLSLSPSLQFIYMWKGLDTMVKENTREEVTVSDGLQLGRSTIDQTDIQTAEDDVSNLKKKLAEVRDWIMSPDSKMYS